MNGVSASSSPVLLNGSCLILSKTLVEKICRKYGYLFYEKYYYYMEDVDLSIRLRAMGLKILKAPELICYHYASSSRKLLKPRFNYLIFRNTLWVIVLTWPFQIILKNIVLIFCVNSYVLCQDTNILIYLTSIVKFCIETLYNGKELCADRKRNLNEYPQNFNFESIFSKGIFKTRKYGNIIY